MYQLFQKGQRVRALAFQGRSAFPNWEVAGLVSGRHWLFGNRGPPLALEVKALEVRSVSVVGFTIS